MRRVGLGVDVGGTASRWAAVDEVGNQVARGASSGATGHIFNPSERERLRLALTTVAEQVADAGLSAATVTVGLTGYGITVAAQVKALLSGIFAVPDAAIMVLDDVMLAYSAVFAPGEGHLVSAGTGSIGVHIGEETGLVRVGGRGILIGDAGSGSWIALRALDGMFRCLDRTGSFAEVEALAQHLFDLVGGSDWHAVRQYVYGGDRGRIGRLAVGVAQAAAEGDALARSILQGAGQELAALAQALVVRCGSKPIAFIGGVLSLHPAVTDAIATKLRGLSFQLPQADVALSAAGLHLEQGATWRAKFRSAELAL